LFGVIAAGGTIGGVVGSFAAQELADQIRVDQLLLIPIFLLEIATWLMTLFHFLAKRFASAAALAVQDEPTGGSFWEGIYSVFQSRYLLAICGMLMLSSICGTTGYFQQIEIIGDAVQDPEQRLKLFARMNLAVQIITVILQGLIVGRLIRWFGLPMVLCILPMVYATSFVGLGLSTTLAMLVAGRVAQRSGAFGVSVPATETLFTVIPREQKYKSKAFIDTAVVRGGDVVASWIYSGLRFTGLTLPGLALTMVPITFVWCTVAWWLGSAAEARRNRKP
jgi:AAA family ATP:ADP antiporter